MKKTATETNHKVKKNFEPLNGQKSSAVSFPRYEHETILYRIFYNSRVVMV